MCHVKTSHVLECRSFQRLRFKTSHQSCYVVWWLMKHSDYIIHLTAFLLCASLRLLLDSATVSWQHNKREPCTFKTIVRMRDAKTLPVHEYRSCQRLRFKTLSLLSLLW